jgi:DNA-binding beta-propeller fold protein YncE
MSGRLQRLGLAVVIAFPAATAAVLASTGGLTPRGCIADPANNPDGCSQKAKGLDFVTSVAVSPDGNSVYATGASDNAIVTFSRNRTTGALKPKGCIADPASNPDGCAKTAKGLGYAYSVAVSPNGKSVYVGGYDGNAIVTFKRNRKTGALTSRGCIGLQGDNVSGCSKTTKGLDFPESVTVSPDGKSVYEAGDSSAVVPRPPMPPHWMPIPA